MIFICVTLQEWCALQNRIDNRAKEKICRKLYYCKICGIDIFQKANSIRHVQKYHGKTHSNVEDCAELLDDVEAYYHVIKVTKIRKQNT